MTGHARSRIGPRPNAVASPVARHPRSLRRIGTPRNGPSGRPLPASNRARSNRVRITASSLGLTASIRAIAASTRSLGPSSPQRTRSACAVASNQVVSITPRTLPRPHPVRLPGQEQSGQPAAGTAHRGRMRMCAFRLCPNSSRPRGGLRRRRRGLVLSSRAFRPSSAAEHFREINEPFALQQAVQRG